VTPQEGLQRFLTALGVEASAVPPDLDAAAALYRSLLADRRVLVVLDNAAAAAQVRPLLPGGAGSIAVVTSRSRLSGLAVREGAHRLTLEVLAEDESVALLQAVISGYRCQQDDDRDLTQLAHLCARLPLALRIAGERAASHPHLQLAQLIDDLRDESVLWDVLSTGDEDEAEAVHTVFAWSYRALSQQAARLFRLLGLHPGPEFALGAAAALMGESVTKSRHLLDALVGAHLLMQTGPDRYQFHDLLRAYAVAQAQRDEPDEGRDEAVHRLLTWYLHTADAAQQWIAPEADRVDLTPGLERLSPVVRFPGYDAAVDWAEKEHTNLIEAIHCAAATHDRLAWQLCAVLWNARPPSTPAVGWLPVFRAGLKAAVRLEDRAAESLMVDHLGLAYTRISQIDKSLACHKKALALRRELGDRPGEAHSLNRVGLAHLRRRCLDAAAEHFREAIALFEELEKPYWAATVQSNLAVTHHRAGRLQQAALLCHQILAIHRALRNLRAEGDTLGLLSALQLEQGDAEAALVSAQAALDTALALRSSMLEGYWLLSVGDAQHARGHYGEALESYQRSAVLHQQLGYRARQALAWYGTGVTYGCLGRRREAVSFLSQAAAVQRGLGDTWNEALALNAMAAAQADAEPRTAREHWTRAKELLAGFNDPRAVAAYAEAQSRIDQLKDAGG
jgi:tetratricopeptide (TPR) repeat protein